MTVRNTAMLAVDFEKLRKIANVRGTSLSNVGTEIGKSANYFSKAEGAGGKISKTTALALAGYFGVSIDAFKVQEEPKEQPASVPADESLAETLAAIETKLNMVSQNVIILKNECRELKNSLDLLVRDVYAGGVNDGR